MIWKNDKDVDCPYSPSDIMVTQYHRHSLKNTSQPNVCYQQMLRLCVIPEEDEPYFYGILIFARPPSRHNQDNLSDERKLIQEIPRKRAYSL
jgi:hypothetical protein